MRKWAERPAGCVSFHALAAIVLALAAAGCARDMSGPLSLKDSPSATSAPKREVRVVKTATDGTVRVHRAERFTADAASTSTPANAFQVNIGGGKPDGVDHATATGSGISASTTGATVDKHCLADAGCRDRVAELAADTGVSWLHAMPVLADDLSGARFLAIRRVRAKLSCSELEIARGSISGSQERLGLVVRRASDETTQANAAGAQHLAGAVLGDVEREQGRRCNASN